MNQTWVLFWLASEPTTAVQQQELQSWANTKNVELVAPFEPTVETQAFASLGTTIAHIEDLLERARVATDALDASVAQELIGRAKDSLAAHPELPQAAWLMAEAYSIEVDLALLSGNEKWADASRRAALSLEGPRSLPASTSTAGNGFGSGFASESKEADSAVRVRIVSGLRPGDQLLWDGVPVLPIDSPVDRWRIETRSGIHHAQVHRQYRLLWSGWVLAEEESDALDLPVPRPEPCSRDDLAPLLSSSWNEVSVACDRWVAARPAFHEQGGAVEQGGTVGGIEVAWCHRNHCGPFQPWPPPRQLPRGALKETPADDADDQTSWWSYALLGTAATATATILLLSITQRGQQERPAWIYGGVR